jgi:hypothetical protein
MNATSVRHLRRLCLLSLLLGGPLVAAGLTPTTAHAKPPTPTLLWKTYPLRQRPTQTEQLALSRALKEKRVAMGSHATEPVPHAVVVALLVATMLLAAMLLLVRHPLPIGGGRSRRRSTRPRGPTARMPSVPRPPARERKVVAERPAEVPVLSEPAAGRSTTGAPDQERERTGARQRPLELELLALVEKARVAPQTEREQLQHEIDRLVDELRARPQTERERERERERELEREHELEFARHELEPTPRPKHARRPGGTADRCEIALWSGVVKNHFFATRTGGSQPEALARSPIFHVRNVEEPSAKAEAALATLLEQLERSGWRVVSEGPFWYQRRLERRSATDPGTGVSNAGT